MCEVRNSEREQVEQCLKTTEMRETARTKNVVFCNGHYLNNNIVFSIDYNGGQIY